MISLSLTSVAILAIVLAVGANFALKSSATLKLRVAIGMFGWDGFLNIVKESIGERLVGKKQTASRLAWQELSDTISDIDFQYLGPQRGFTEVGDLAEGHRFLSHVVKQAFDVFLENDPLFPKLIKFSSPYQKVLGDNPDAFYHVCNLDNDKVYKVTGKMQDEAYVSFTLAESKCSGCFTNGVVGDMNHFQLKMKEDGISFEVYFSKEKPENVDNWMPLNPSDSSYKIMLITRHYYERKEYAQNDHTLRQLIDIELVGGNQGGLRDPPRNDEIMAQKLRNVKTYILEHTVRMKSDPASSPSWFSFTPNLLGAPVMFREDSKNKDAGGGFGAVDICYSAGLFKLKPGEALIMEAKLPNECAFASVNIWNRFLQTIDYQNNPNVSLNRKQMTIGNDNTVKIWISPTPPENDKYDWLNTEGRAEGFLFWRFILPSETPSRPTLTLVKV